jgi:NAD(P)-dependent dehydrogenase (short-subunit alcohol dehydrogenase family)
MKKVCLITGACSGLGLALFNQLENSSGPFDVVVGFDHNDGPKWNQFKGDVRSKEDWERLKDWLHKKDMEVSVIIHCCGVNYIEYIESMLESEWDRIMDVNAKGIFLGTQAFLPDLVTHKGAVINIVSNAAHIPMTSSLAYNASKGAAHIMTLQMARELTRRYGITVFGVAPNKMAGTAMSTYIEQRVPDLRGWTPEQARKYQESSLMAGETPPSLVAEFISFLLSSKERHQHLTGTIIPYGA